MIAEGAFREDLFYRLSVFPLRLPPLRERREDLPGLARMFLKRFAAAEGTSVEGFAPAAMEAIIRAPWPGNVRQLENTIHRAVVMADGPLIQPGDLHGMSRSDGRRRDGAPARHRAERRAARERARSVPARRRARQAAARDRGRGDQPCALASIAGG